MPEHIPSSFDWATRHWFLQVSGALVGGAFLPSFNALAQLAPRQQSTPGPYPLSLRINEQSYKIQVDPREVLLDVLRDRLHLMGTKRGCNHGQCGACTVLINGERLNSCLSLALLHDGDTVTTIEGLARGSELHPVQAAFIAHDGFQCGYCTPGQICSTVAMLHEIAQGTASTVTANVRQGGRVELSDDEIRERLSGNICRCGAYVGILAAVREAAQAAPFNSTTPSLPRG